jgi:site-specific recombinase XerC
VEVLLAEFGDHLTGERGLAPASVRSYLRYAGVFLAELPAPPAAALAELSAGQVTAFMVRQAGRQGGGTAKATVTALRSLLRFLHAAGHVPAPLAAAVPSVPARAAALPRPVDAGEVAAVLAGCDRDGAVGRRDYAILLLLVRLGLRAGEVCAVRSPSTTSTGGPASC